MAKMTQAITRLGSKVNANSRQCANRDEYGEDAPARFRCGGCRTGRGVSAQADVVALTGAFFTNHTFDGLIRLCRPRAFVLMLGDFVPFTPLLFDHGVDALC